MHRDFLSTSVEKGIQGSETNPFFPFVNKYFGILAIKRKHPLKNGIDSWILYTMCVLDVAFKLQVYNILVLQQ